MTLIEEPKILDFLHLVFCNKFDLILQSINLDISNVVQKTENPKFMWIMVWPSFTNNKVSEMLYYMNTRLNFS